MAGAGPYGIEQVDVPGIIGGMQNTQFNRIRMMMAQKQLEMTERQMNIQSGTMQALQSYAQSLNGGSDGAYGTSAGTSGSGSAQTGSSGPPAASPVTSMPHASDVVQPPSSAPASAAPAAAPAAAPPAGPYDTNGIPTSGTMAARQRVVTGLSVLNPEMAGQLQETFSKMDEGQVAAVTARHTRISQLAAGALQLPQSERAAFIQQHAAELQSLGMPPQSIASFQPTDGNLRGLVAEGMDIQRVAEFAKPQVVDVRQGGAAVTVNPDETSTTNYESPVIGGPNGEVFARPSALSTMSHPMTATNPKTNERLQSLDGGKTWQPLGGQTPPASGGFPVNNPGNLRVPGSTQFQTFATPQAGVQAQEAQLGRYMQRGLNNVSSIVETYAPRQSRGGDNTDAQVNNYIGYVSKRLGVNPSAPIPAAMLSRLAEAMREFETGRRVE